MKKILIVDDEPATRLVKLKLGSTGLYEVFTENKGSFAVAAAVKFKPDLILLDILMPDLLDSEVAAAIHEDPVLSHIKVIYLTSMLKEGEEQKTGENFVIGKPISTEDLLAVVAQNSPEPVGEFLLAGTPRVARDRSDRLRRVAWRNWNRRCQPRSCGHAGRRIARPPAPDSQLHRLQTSCVLQRTDDLRPAEETRHNRNELLREPNTTTHKMGNAGSHP